MTAPEDIRVPMLLVLNFAALRGETALDLQSIQERIRPRRFRPRLIMANADELVSEGLAERLRGPDQRYRISVTGGEWLRQKFGNDWNPEGGTFVPQTDGADLPDPSSAFRAEMQKEARRRVVTYFLILGAVLAAVSLIWVIS